MKKFKEFVSNKEGQKTLILIRGIPGSGKSYTAKQMLEKYGGGDPHEHIFSTDDFFIQDAIKDRRERQAAGENINSELEAELEKDAYTSSWTPQKLGIAHGWNFSRFQQAIDKGVNPVIVDNTNVKAKEMRKYAQYANQAGYGIEIQEPTSKWWQDHAHMLSDKENHGEALENFARYLAGHHQGMEKQYGARGNVHGVPLDTIRGMLRRWQPNINIDDVLKKN